MTSAWTPRLIYPDIKPRPFKAIGQTPYWPHCLTNPKQVVIYTPCKIFKDQMPKSIKFTKSCIPVWWGWCGSLGSGVLGGLHDQGLPGVRRVLLVRGVRRDLRLRRVPGVRRVQPARGVLRVLRLRRVPPVLRGRGVLRLRRVPPVLNIK